MSGRRGLDGVALGWRRSRAFAHGAPEDAQRRRARGVAPSAAKPVREQRLRSPPPPLRRAVRPSPISRRARIPRSSSSRPNRRCSAAAGASSPGESAPVSCSTRRGLILTNDHVVANATRIDVVFGEEDRRRATVIGSDTPTDIAVLRVDGQGLASVCRSVTPTRSGSATGSSPSAIRSASRTPSRRASCRPRAAPRAT